MRYLTVGHFYKIAIKWRNWLWKKGTSKKHHVLHSGCVHTNRVDSSPVQSSQTHKDAAVCLWLTYNGRRGRAYTPAESSWVESHESCRVKSLDAACLIFVRIQWSGGAEEMDVEKFILLFKDHEAIYDTSRCEHQNRVLLWWWWWCSWQQKQQHH